MTGPRPVGKKTRRIEFTMPKFKHTEYHGKHNHEGKVAHRFLVELSYARESEKKTPMKELADLIYYAEAYDMENHTYSAGHSKTNPEMSKVALYVRAEDAKRIEELLWKLRHHIGIYIGAESKEEPNGFLFFNSIDVQDYVISD